MILYYTIIKKIYGGFLIKNMPCFKKIISYKICDVQSVNVIRVLYESLLSNTSAKQ